MKTIDKAIEEIQGVTGDNDSGVKTPEFATPYGMKDTKRNKMAREQLKNATILKD